MTWGQRAVSSGGQISVCPLLLVISFVVVFLVVASLLLFGLALLCFSQPASCAYSPPALAEPKMAQ